MKLFTCLIFLTAIVAVLSAEVASAENDSVRRQKRSFSWIPLFGRSSSDDEKENGEVLVPAQSQVTNNGFTYSGSPPDASSLNAIISRGQFINNQIHHPIWRVHRYNGVHLQPLPVRFVGGVNGINAISGTGIRAPAPVGAPNFIDQNTIENIPSNNNDNDDDDDDSESDSNSNSGNSNNNNNSNKPSSTISLSQIPPELIQIALENGITDPSQIDIEEVMNLLGTTTPEDTLETIKDIASTEDGRKLIRDFIGQNKGSASTKVETVVKPDLQAAETIPFAQFLLPQAPRSNDEEGESTPGIFQSVARFANFLNPFGTGEEIPLPENEEVVVTDDDEEEIAQPNVDSEYATIPLPALPELPPIPELPGAVPPLPELPQIHVPANGLVQLPPGGPYVRVRLPLAGFNPTPQIPIDPRYLYQLRSQQPGFGVQQRFGQNTVAQTITIPTGNLVPNFHAGVFGSSSGSSYNSVPGIRTSSGGSSIPSVAQLPLSQSNFLAFKNAPQIKTSYGAPALPFANPIESSDNYFVPSPGSPNTYIHQEYELRPAASERVEQRAPQPTSDGDNGRRPDQLQNDREVVPRLVENNVYESAASEVEPIVVTPVSIQSQATHKSLSQINEPVTETRTKKRKTLRHTAHDTFATGKVHTVDPKALELLPFTVRKMIENENQWINQKKKGKIKNQNIIYLIYLLTKNIYSDFIFNSIKKN